jgi:hypothetical protein
MNRNQLATTSIDLLNSVLEQAYLHLQKKPEDLREAFVYRHARNISQLAYDVLSLENRNQTDSSPIIVRVMLEGLFKMATAVKVERASVEIVICEIDDEIHRIKLWMIESNEENEGLNDTIQQLTSFVQSLRGQYGLMENSKKWTTFECAKAAELGTIYRQFYFLFSKHTHATASGIIAQEAEVVSSLVKDTVIFVILCAVGQLSQILEAKEAQCHIDEAARLLDVATKLIGRKW